MTSPYKAPKAMALPSRPPACVRDQDADDRRKSTLSQRNGGKLVPERPEDAENGTVPQRPTKLL